MSVVGIDFGAQSTKIGVARNKGIDIVSILWIFFFFFFLALLYFFQCCVLGITQANIRFSPNF